jgi:hypothetical protein
MNKKITIQWPGGYSENYWGTESDAIKRICETASDPSAIQRKETAFGPSFSEIRLGPFGNEAQHLGAIVLHP